MTNPTTRVIFTRCWICRIKYGHLKNTKFLTLPRPYKNTGSHEFGHLLGITHEDFYSKMEQVGESQQDYYSINSIMGKVLIINGKDYILKPGEKDWEYIFKKNDIFKNYFNK